MDGSEIITLHGIEIIIIIQILKDTKKRNILTYFWLWHQD